MIQQVAAAQRTFPGPMLVNLALQHGLRETQLEFPPTAARSRIELAKNPKPAPL